VYLFSYDHGSSDYIHQTAINLITTLTGQLPVIPCHLTMEENQLIFTLTSTVHHYSFVVGLNSGSALPTDSELILPHHQSLGLYLSCIT
jgi:hypothetical protein